MKNLLSSPSSHRFCLWASAVFLAVPSARLHAQETKASSHFKDIKPPAGFTATLFAQPPQVLYPTSISTSPDGRKVFVAEDENGSLDRKEKRGRVVQCLDTDGDGKADKVTTFAEMDSPRGVIWEPRGKGGVLYVMHPPLLTAYYDETGSGKPSHSEDLITGLGFDLSFRGADHTTNGCRLGPDGWIYIACGDYGAVEAKGKDGRLLPMKGGGVVRVRTDGSGLEFVSRGQRNIYDVAVSPTLDLFTRDNTNDGDGWNDRLSHIVQGATYGYPSLFKNFKEDMIDALVDYGGGSPVGSLFVDEPAFPTEWANMLLTAEWGPGKIDAHPLTPNGASFKADKVDFLKLPRPSDLDADGVGDLFVTSWDGASFVYSGPDVGFIIRLKSTAGKAKPAPDLATQTDAQLVALIGGESAVWRLGAQRELLARGPAKTETIAALYKIADAPGNLGSRVAAIFTLKLLLGEKAHPALQTLAKKDELREFALKALADDPRLKAKVPAQIFTVALADSNPRVRLQAVTALARLGKTEAAASLIPLTADPDLVVAHVATRSLTALHATEVLLGALDSREDKVKPGALRALYGLYDVKVVDGLITQLAKSTDPVLRRGILNALCRLDQRETPYVAGTWWTTRPDTSGPVYKGERWEGSDKIEAALKLELDRSPETEVRWLAANMFKCKVNFPGLIEIMLAKAGQDTEAKLNAVEGMFGPHQELPPEGLEALGSVANSSAQSPEMRARALSLLARSAAVAPGFDAAVTAFAPLAGQDLVSQPLLASAFENFSRDPKNNRQSGILGRLAKGSDPQKRTLALTLLVNLTTSPLLKEKEKDNAQKIIADAWSNPETAAALLGAIARTKSASFADAVRARLNDPNPTVAEAALFATQSLGLAKTGKENAPATKNIGALKFEQVVAEVTQMKGDPTRGRELFLSQGCIACHTVSANEPPKGPLLAGIGQRNTRAQLCESIMKPSAVISQGFESQWFDTTKGEHFEGFVTRESGDSLEIRSITGQSSKIELSDLKARGKREQSIMPEGLVANLTPADLGSLIAYLESLKK